jgi:hypothetical protein
MTLHAREIVATPVAVATPMTFRHGHLGGRTSPPVRAREQATVLKAKGDHEGHAVWTRVAEHAEHFLREAKERAQVALAPEREGPLICVSARVFLEL